ncbi:MAG: ParA family protein [Ardenticatenaceae bacterium]|nr:ParA family protein [Ardenticatenaceae bacterium]
MRLAIASQKGGTGKTTTSITLAAGLGHQEKRILLIDMDSQANASKVLLPNYHQIPKEQTVFATILQREPLTIHATAIPGLDIAPAHILLSNTDIELTIAKDHREARLKNQLEAIQDEYDHVIIDCPPALSWLTVNAFTSVERVVVVVAPGYFELDSIVQLNKSLEEVREYYNPALQLLGFLFTMSDPTINSRTSLKLLRQTYGDQVFKTIIPRNTDVRDAHFNKLDVFSASPKAKVAVAYHKFIKELGL